jgi:hypothetical protein
MYNQIFPIPKYFKFLVFHSYIPTNQILCELNDADTYVILNYIVVGIDMTMYALCYTFVVFCVCVLWQRQHVGAIITRVIL